MKLSSILLVEDDEFKAADLISAAGECWGDVEFYRAASVTSASRLLLEKSFDLCVLDMSLPTFDMAGAGGGGSPQGQGGLDVLRLAKIEGIMMPFIIVTQYPDIEIDRREVALADAAAALRRAGHNVSGCVHYQFDGSEWRSQLAEIADGMATGAQ